tara:strand:- start:5000 stop:6841 length:1842 start_codon:yes stop_codon:yes gene_type:complete
MIGIILAAGRGQKINVLDMPKPLLRVYGKELIIWQIKYLIQAGIRDIIIITGSHGAGVRSCVRNADIKNAQIKYIEQPDDDANILQSFELAQTQVKSDCVIASCDLIFERNPYSVLSKRKDIEILVSKHKEENAFSGAPIRVKTRLKKLAAIGKGLDSYNALHAGIYYFTKKGINNFLSAARGADSNEELSKVIMRSHKKNPVKLAFLRCMEWFDINSTDTLLRAEMFMRRQSLSVKPLKASESFKEISPNVSFTYTKSQETSIIVEQGIMNQLGKIKLMDKARVNSQHIIITDENVDAILGESVLSQLQNTGYKASKFVIEAGEQSKRMEVYNDLAEKIIALGIDENSVIFALGGGVVANISGLLAATLYRGIGLIHLPTTIMNMLDVSISLKQGINSQKGKNLVGSYYQPLLVVIDPAINIPDWLVRDGISEAIKHAICQDKNFYKYLLENAHKVSDSLFRKEIIERTIQLKIELMNEDMFEHKRAMILQYGHEVGHAIEFFSRFELTHGQSIAIGMRVSAELAKLMNAGDDSIKAHKKIMKAYNLPYSIPRNMSSSAVIDALKYNKKTQASEARFVLPDFVGKVWKIKGEYGIPCPVELIKKAVENSYEK